MQSAMGGVRDGWGQRWAGSAMGRSQRWGAGSDGRILLSGRAQGSVPRAPSSCPSGPPGCPSGPPGCPSPHLDGAVLVCKQGAVFSGDRHIPDHRGQEALTHSSDRVGGFGSSCQGAHPPCPGHGASRGPGALPLGPQSAGTPPVQCLHPLTTGCPWPCVPATADQDGTVTFASVLCRAGGRAGSPGGSRPL